MPISDISVNITQRWWVRPLLAILAGVYRATGYCPSPDKLSAFLADKGFIYALQGKKG